VLVMALVRAAQAHLRCSADDAARDVLAELFTLPHRLGTRPFRAEELEAAAVLAARAGEPNRAARCLGAADGVRAVRAEERGGVDVLGPALAAVRADVGNSGAPRPSGRWWPRPGLG
jgi:hypothetical protein